MEKILNPLASSDAMISLYQNACDICPDPTLILDREYRYLYANPAYLNIVDLPLDQVVNHTISEIEGTDAFQLIKPRVDSCLSGKKLTFSSQVYLANPVLALLHVNLTPFRDETGVVTHVFVIMRKSDSHFQTEQETAFSQSLLSKSLVSSPQPIIITTLKGGQILQLNDAGFRLLGYTPEELIGKKMRDFCLETSYRDNLIKKMQRDKQCTIPNLPIKHKNGSIVHIEVVLNATFFNGIPAILGFCRDKTAELLALQTETDKANTLRLLRTIAEAANEAQDIESAFNVCLEEVCNYCHWPVGHALLLNEKTQQLETTGIWCVSDQKHRQPLQQWAEHHSFGEGEGLPGRVLETADIVCIPDLAEDDPTPRNASSANFVMRSAFAFPVLVGDKVAAVLEFFSPAQGSISDNLLDALRPVGVQLGRIIERQQAENTLRASNEHYQRLMNDIDAIVWEADLPTLQASFISTSVEKILGYPQDNWFQPNFWPDHIHPDDRERVISLVKNQVVLQQDYELEYRMLKANGSTIWLRDVAHIVTDKNNQPVKLRGVMFDVSEHKRLSAELEYQASHDNLTSLYNRDVFERRLSALLSSDLTNRQHALCYLDLDQFKVINDACGHLAGDALLHQLGAILRTRLRSEDTLARLGGDEFGILIEDCTIDQAYQLTEQIRRLIQDFRFVWEQRRYSIGVSVGLIPINQNSGTLKEVLSAADMACYAAKDAGRNRIRVYHPNDQELAFRRREMDWVGKINHALEENRFQLYIQPIKALQGAQEGGHYEVLVRMIGKDGAVIAPGAFLPAAERYNLSTQIDQWVVKTTLDWLLANPMELKSLAFCSINLSGLSLNNSAFSQYLLDQLKRASSVCTKICFEITETAAISNLASAIKFIEAVKSIGCLFALDDFGSGLSSFNYLKNLPVDFLKIDGSFVVDITTDPIDYEMVRSINEIGHVMGKKTIAEFVENKQTLSALKRLGVDYAQGYYIGKPIPLYKRGKHLAPPIVKTPVKLHALI